MLFVKHSTHKSPRTRIVTEVSKKLLMKHAARLFNAVLFAYLSYLLIIFRLESILTLLSQYG